MRVLAATHARIAIGSSILPKCIPTVRPFPALQRPITSSRSGRQSVRVAAAIEFIEDEVSDGEGDVIYEDFQGVRLRDRGYTPFEFIEFTNIPLKHEVAVWVDRPVADCYKVWQNRLNWMQWFGMIDEVGFHEEQPSYISMYLWYRWASTPFLELYVTLERTKEELNKYILEEPVEGFPLVAAVLFQEGDEGDEGQQSGTTVTLRLSYLLPKVLLEFAGQVAVYGDVNRKLQSCMVKMKEFIETADMAELEQTRQENEQEIRANFALQQEQKQEALLKQREQNAAIWAAAAARANAGASAEADAEAGGEAVKEEEASVTENEVNEGGKRRKRAKAGAQVNNPAARRRGKEVEDG